MQTLLMLHTADGEITELFLKYGWENTRNEYNNKKNNNKINENEN